VCECSYRPEEKLLIIWEKLHLSLAEMQLQHGMMDDFAVQLGECLEASGINVRSDSKEAGVWWGLEPRQQEEVLQFLLSCTSDFDILGVRAAEQQVCQLHVLWRVHVHSCSRQG
jgi:hypothetical protein